MDVRRLGLAVAALATLCALAVAQDTTAGQQPADQSPSASPPSASSPSPSSAGKPVHQTGAGPHSASHHVTVAEESEQLPELTQAESFIQKHDNAAAEPLLQKAVSREPANYEAWFDLGFVENALGKVEESIAAYRKSVAAKPDVFESNLNLGLQLAKTGQPDAEQYLRAATQLKPTSHVAEGQYRAWLSLGHVIDPSKPDEAVAAYRKAEAMQPNESEPHEAAGRIFEMQKKYGEAEEEYKKALALNPTSDALTGLANCYMQERRLPEAEEYLRKVVALHSQEAAPHVQLGRVLAAEGKNDDAIGELETGLKSAPGDVSVQRDLAETYMAAGKTGQAEAEYRTLVSANPQDAGLHRALGQTLLHEKKFPEAQQEFMAAIKFKPDFGETYGDLAFAASENKDYALTVKALSVRAKMLPETPLTYFLRASALDHLKDLKDAAQNYRLFLKAAEGKYPDQEWQAKHRLVAIEPKK